jgi:hypothetical protein
MAIKHHFRVSGYEFSLSKKDIEHKLATIKSEGVRKLFVVVGHKKFPVKQAFEAVCPELIRSEVQSAQALHVFKKCGFSYGKEEE